MKVLFVTPECAPLAKTGGLGDVSAALPAALHSLGIDVRILLPGYPAVLQAAGPAHACAVLGSDARLLEWEGFLILDCPRLFVREGGPYQNARGEDWPDNALRFGLLSQTAALLGSARSPLSWRPDVLHCNDWPAGLAPAFLAGERPRAASVITVHNLAFQGNFDRAFVERLELAPQLFTPEGIEFHGRVSFLKGGLAYADAITTVSPSYAGEIQTAEFGCGLDGLLRRRSAVLCGILNGIDTAQWNPATDARIPATYDAGSLERKQESKRALQQRLALERRDELPLLGMVGRLTHQKGADLLAEAAPHLVATPAQLAVLGTGEERYEIALRELAARFPGRIAATIGFDEDLAHLIEAGADLFLMPSRFEPCGLNQMYSQRYGTLPVVRATGGLADTVMDGETGFLFQRAEAAALCAAVHRALEAWNDVPRRRALQRAAMARDFSWGASARRYGALYSALATSA